MKTITLSQMNINILTDYLEQNSGNDFPGKMQGDLNAILDILYAASASLTGLDDDGDDIYEDVTDNQIESSRVLLQ